MAHGSESQLWSDLCRAALGNVLALFFWQPPHAIDLDAVSSPVVVYLGPGSCMAVWAGVLLLLLVSVLRTMWSEGGFAFGSACPTQEDSTGSVMALSLHLCFLVVFQNR